MMYSQKEQQNWSSSQTLMVLAPASRIVKTKNFGIKSNGALKIAHPQHGVKYSHRCLSSVEGLVCCQIKPRGPRLPHWPAVLTGFPLARHSVLPPSPG